MVIFYHLTRITKFYKDIAMKIRTGFVSNSSSASFCIAKCYMTEEQVKLFREWRDLAESYEELYDETCIEESTYYFGGEVAQSDFQTIEDKLVELGVDPKYIG